MSASTAPLPLTVLVPPINFSMINIGLFRSGFPVDINFPFISRLRLHTILNLASEEYSRDTIAFLDRNNISCVCPALPGCLCRRDALPQLRPHQSHGEQVCWSLFLSVRLLCLSCRDCLAQGTLPRHVGDGAARSPRHPSPGTSLFRFTTPIPS